MTNPICPACGSESIRTTANDFFPGRDYPIFACLPCRHLVNVGRDQRPTGVLAPVGLYAKRRDVFNVLNKMSGSMGMSWNETRQRMHDELSKDIPPNLKLTDATSAQVNAILEWYNENYKERCTR